MAIMIKTPQEIEKMRRSGAVVREVLEHVKALVKPGVTTLDLELAAESKMAALGATSAFKGYRGYPCVLCTSVNEQVVHGIPSSERVLREGDIVSIDTGVVLDGYYGNHRSCGSRCSAENEAVAGCDQGFAGDRNRRGA
jgi:methionyl aminopeptidase